MRRKTRHAPGCEGARNSAVPSPDFTMAAGTGAGAGVPLLQRERDPQKLPLRHRSEVETGGDEGGAVGLGNFGEAFDAGFAGVPCRETGGKIEARGEPGDIIPDGEANLKRAAVGGGLHADGSAVGNQG